MRQRSALPTEYVEIQLRFAETMAERLHLPPADAVLRCTNLFRRFGLGNPAAAMTNVHWRRYITKLVDLRSTEDRVLWTKTFASSMPAETNTSTAIARSGPFSAEVIDNTLRTHFMPVNDPEGPSPLDPCNRDVRRKELQTVVLDALAARPEITRARGTSWLYTTEGYRSLFPPAHIATATVRTEIFTFQGSSSWGQFLDHRGNVKQNLRDNFIGGLASLDPAAPWLSFPIPTMVVDSPIDVFRAYFEP